MSDSRPADDRARLSRLDALLSAERDGALDPDERAELDALLANDPAAPARRAAFAAADEALVALGREPLDEASIADGLEALRARTGREGSTAPSSGVQLDARRASWRHPVVPLLAGAAAAALMLFLAVSSTETVEAPRPRVVQVPAAIDTVDPLDAEDEMLDFDPELAIALPIALPLALGHGEGAELVPGVDDEDLAVISELDLLDFMAALEAQERG